MDVQKVEAGALFKDNDTRHPSPRVVKVIDRLLSGGKVLVENVEHWDEKQIGRRTWIKRDRLELGKHRQRGYTKVSR